MISRLPHLLPLSLLPLLLTACLAPDPERAIPDDASPLPERVEQVVTAPRTLDPRILASRAFNEAPLLARAVSEGRLPPVSDRLPKNPRVIAPTYEIGTYGGQIRRALTGDIVQIPASMKAKNDGLLIFSHPLCDSLEPNLAETWAFRDSGRVLDLRLRDGIRWSDGHPFSADDVLFYFNDVLFNENARPSDITSVPPDFVEDGKPIRLEKRDSLTVRFSGSRPIPRVASWLGGVSDAAMPLHVYRQWHPRYNPDASWEDFRERATRAQFMYTPGMPTLGAWRPVEWTHGQRIVYERNPYYWKVDTAGNQLPYADRLVFTVIPDRQVILLKFLNGELDLFGRYSQLDMFQTLKEAETRRGGFRMYLSGPTPAHIVYLNWDAESPNVRAAFRNRNVRIALSHALNREEIGELNYYGFLVPGGYSFYPPNEYATDDGFKAFSAYDPERARRLLDAEGYVDRDGDGIREFSDGTPFTFTLDIVSSGGGADVSELIVSNWRDIGIRVIVYAALRDIIMPRRLAGDYEAHYWWFDGADDPLGGLDSWIMTRPGMPFWHRNGTEEAPEWLREATRLLYRASGTIDTAVVREAMTRARDLYTENVPGIAFGAAYRAWGASNRLGNVPETVAFRESRGDWGRALGHEQLFIKNIEK